MPIGGGHFSPTKLKSPSAMSVPETKELKAEWKTETVLPEYTLKDVAAHNTKGDTWMVIHGQGTCLDTPYA